MDLLSSHTRDDWSFPTSLFGWNQERPSNIHVTTCRSRFSTILASWFTIFRFLSNFLSLNYMNLTLKGCFLIFWLLSVLITKTTDGMLKDNIDIMCLRSLLRQERIIAYRPNRISLRS